ncbi:hypothetical protein QFC22_003016 [Naganishia vaughanmartiniae]|uniref:Uncharacterized protein n=1 Tax=Naganishia vaughanmartiniae TaxID=1424756 RepID=A0ACC2X8J2_9TREE|nr:hypothetical protein QFC22_003016 [Naganishia vaughanmartiniae]
MSSNSGSSKKEPLAISQSTLFDLKGIVSEHRSTFDKEGRTALKGRSRPKDEALSKDKFARPSPGIIKRMALEARNELNRKHLAHISKASEKERQEIMRIKAEKYDKLKRGDYGVLSEKELAEITVDFDRKWEEEDEWSDHSSDIDESAGPGHQNITTANGAFDDAFSREKVEYVDELGRTRIGTRAEAREADMAKQTSEVKRLDPMEDLDEGQPEIGPAHAEVLQSNVIYGPQSFFPVYEPTQEDLRARLKAAEGPADTKHYDANEEVRARAAGHYQFSQDETKRAEQMAALKAERNETQQARDERRNQGVGVNEMPAAKGQPAGKKMVILTPAQETKKRKLDERRALIEAKRIKMLGGKEGIEKKRQELQDQEAERLLREVESSLQPEQKESPC